MFNLLFFVVDIFVLVFLQTFYQQRRPESICSTIRHHHQHDVSGCCIPININIINIGSDQRLSYDAWIHGYLLSFSRYDIDVFWLIWLIVAHSHSSRNEWKSDAFLISSHLVLSISTVLDKQRKTFPLSTDCNIS